MGKIYTQDSIQDNMLRIYKNVKVNNMPKG